MPAQYTLSDTQTFLLGLSPMRRHLNNNINSELEAIDRTRNPNKGSASDNDSHGSNNIATRPMTSKFIVQTDRGDYRERSYQMYDHNSHTISNPSGFSRTPARRTDQTLPNHAVASPTATSLPTVSANTSLPPQACLKLPDRSHTMVLSWRIALVCINILPRRLQASHRHAAQDVQSYYRDMPYL
ncbi:hypothetical protein K490DRAFT_59042 [Saccharata proteae CBS 121410]|uniref:Uncharacterized protein n=1 Tax=Saccharata proteae CBS 121410 TaxID=1314787 RepID=A0A9P4HTL1_9PEZI|nr:hypothetical protein K490DRAFT_59042 [Saccharata proteae CBS 121410]